MRRDDEFVSVEEGFWAYVRAVSQAMPTKDRTTHMAKTYGMADILFSLDKLNYPHRDLGTALHPTQLFCHVKKYLDYRAKVLNDYVEPNLMDLDDAAREFESLRLRLGVDNPRILIGKTGNNMQPIAKIFDVHGTSIRVAMNKQKNEKRNINYFTGMIDLIIADALGQESFDSDPQQLATLCDDDGLLATFSRRMDGAYPSTVNPRALWEIKEYYYTTTFGSKISDAVYVSELDGYEVNEARSTTGFGPEIYLMVDSHFTWWNKGLSYLCRLIDALNMGRVDEILFGREIFTRLPALVQSWLD
jgi:hypothetical protein